MGGWDLEAYAQDDQMTDMDIPWIPIQEDSWTLGISGVRFAQAAETIPIKSSQLSLDTGLSYVMAPTEDIEHMATALKKQGVKCKPDPAGSNLDLYKCKCNAEALA
jgi:hypothetical protein